MNVTTSFTKSDRDHIEKEEFSDMHEGNSFPLFIVET